MAIRCSFPVDWKRHNFPRVFAFVSVLLFLRAKQIFVARSNRIGRRSVQAKKRREREREKKKQLTMFLSRSEGLGMCVYLMMRVTTAILHVRSDKSKQRTSKEEKKKERKRSVQKILFSLLSS